MHSDFSLIDAIRYTGIASSLLPPAAYLIWIRRMPRQNHIIGLVVIISALCEFIALYQFNNHRSTALLSNVYFMTFFALACWYYYELLFKLTGKTYFYLGIAAYTISFAVVSFSMRGMLKFQSEMWAIGGVILAAFAILYSNHLPDKRFSRDRNLYSTLFINGGIFLYFSFNLFFFVIGNYMLTQVDPETSRMTWAFHNVNNIIKNLALTIGLYYTNRRKIEDPSAMREVYGINEGKK